MAYRNYLNEIDSLTAKQFQKYYIDILYIAVHRDMHLKVYFTLFWMT